MDYSAGGFPIATIICIIVAMILSVGVPIALLVYFKSKTAGPIMPVIVGAIIFVIFAMGLEQICHTLLLTNEGPIKDIVSGSKWGLAVYGALAAALFEEFGRFIAFKYALKKADAPSNSLLYGVGHGGMEAILVGGITMMNNLALAVTLRDVGLEKFMSQYDAKTADTVRDTVTNFYSAKGSEFLMGGGERVMALFLQIALSVLVFVAIKNAKKKFLFPLAIFIHFIADFPAGMYQSGILKQVAPIEVFTLVITAVVCVFAYREYGKYQKECMTEGGDGSKK